MILLPQLSSLKYNLILKPDPNGPFTMAYSTSMTAFMFPTTLICNSTYSKTSMTMSSQVTLARVKCLLSSDVNILGLRSENS